MFSTTIGLTLTPAPAGIIIRSCYARRRLRPCRDRACSPIVFQQNRTSPSPCNKSPRALAFLPLHVNFTNDEDQNLLTATGMLARMGEQFHWFNHGYQSFDDFLGALSSRKRKAIKRERRQAAAEGLAIRQLPGSEITDEHWDAFWSFYQDTGARKWGQPYLTRDFFALISNSIADRLLFVVAERNGKPVAGALHLIGGDTLYGRYWGCTEDIPFMHFELCYYQAIDYAIKTGLSRVEAGAQGDHKIARGYEPVPTYSAHWIANESFREAIAQYLDAERQQTGMEIVALRTYVPFKRQ